MNQASITDEFVQKTVKEIRKNIARRERKAFGNGILWSVASTWLGMGIGYATGNSPNPGIMVGSLFFGLYYRFRKDQ